MIEVEKKFLLREEDEERLIDGAVFLDERSFTDLYYDTQDFSLTTKDSWLRARDGKFELKIPLHGAKDRLADQYDEIEDEGEIRKYLLLESSGTMEELLFKAGYSSFCTCTTTRRKYKRGEFIIDLDVAAFSGFSYRIGEIELMVSEAGEVPRAIDKIVEFATAQALVLAPVRGKVLEYLKRMSPVHYQALVEADVVPA